MPLLTNEKGKEVAEIQSTVSADEKTYQTKFYEAIWGGGRTSTETSK